MYMQVFSKVKYLQRSSANPLRGIRYLTNVYISSFHIPSNPTLKEAYVQLPDVGHLSSVVRTPRMLLDMPHNPTPFRKRRTVSMMPMRTRECRGLSRLCKYARPSDCLGSYGAGRRWRDGRGSREAIALS